MNKLPIFIFLTFLLVLTDSCTKKSVENEIPVYAEIESKQLEITDVKHNIPKLDSNIVLRATLGENPISVYTTSQNSFSFLTPDLEVGRYYLKLDGNDDFRIAVNVTENKLSVTSGVFLDNYVSTINAKVLQSDFNAEISVSTLNTLERFKIEMAKLGDKDKVSLAKFINVNNFSTGNETNIRKINDDSFNAFAAKLALETKLLLVSINVLNASISASVLNPVLGKSLALTGVLGTAIPLNSWFGNLITLEGQYVKPQQLLMELESSEEISQLNKGNLRKAARLEIVANSANILNVNLESRTLNKADENDTDATIKSIFTSLGSIRNAIQKTSDLLSEIDLQQYVSSWFFEMPEKSQTSVSPITIEKFTNQTFTIDNSKVQFDISFIKTGKIRLTLKITDALSANLPISTNLRAVSSLGNGDLLIPINVKKRNSLVGNWKVLSLQGNIPGEWRTWSYTTSCIDIPLEQRKINDDFRFSFTKNSYKITGTETWARRKIVIYGNKSCEQDGETIYSQESVNETYKYSITGDTLTNDKYLGKAKISFLSPDRVKLFFYLFDDPAYATYELQRILE